MFKSNGLMCTKLLLYKMTVHVNLIDQRSSQTAGRDVLRDMCEEYPRIWNGTGEMSDRHQSLVINLQRSFTQLLVRILKI